MPDLRVLSLGAGVQSTTLILMAVNGEFDAKPDVAIFSDTGWEPKAVYDHLDWLEREVDGRIPIIRVSKGNLRDDSLSGKRVATMPVYIRNADGTKGMLRRQCTSEYKIMPINRKIRELLGAKRGQRLDKVAELWFGISLDEWFRMKESKRGWLEHRYPLIEKEMDRYGCLKWLESRGYPRPPKSACIGCPFHGDHYWRTLLENSPDEFADAVEFDRLIRRGYPKVKGEAYLHKSLLPLDQVDLRTLREKGQITLWDDDFGNECGGYCGV